MDSIANFMKNFFSVIIFTQLLTSCAEYIECGDEDVTNLVSEIALDILNGHNNELVLKNACIQPTYGLLMLAGIDCRDVFEDFFSSLSSPSVEVKGIRTLSKSDNGKNFCAAQVDFRYQNKDLNPEIINFFTQKLPDNKTVRDNMIKQFHALEISFNDTYSTSAEYDVQLTDKGDEFYVNLTLNEIPEP